MQNQLKPKNPNNNKKNNVIPITILDTFIGPTTTGDKQLPKIQGGWLKELTKDDKQEVNLNDRQVGNTKDKQVDQDGKQESWRVK